MNKVEKKKLLLKFPAATVDKPFTYLLIKDFDLKVNIFKARVTPEESGELGIELEGESKNMQDAMLFLEKHNIEIEPLSKKIIWDKEKCTACGVCVALCPAKAISVDKETREVEYDKDKCIACGLCSDGCPFNVISIKF